MKDPKEIADKYLEKYATLTASSTRILLISVVVIAANWLFIVESNYSKYKSVKIEFGAKLKKIEDKFLILSKIPAEDSIEAKRIEAKKDSLSNEKKHLTERKETSLKDKMSEIKDIPSFIKFVFFISDSETGGLILNVALLILLLYFSFTRRVCLKYLAKALRIYKIEPALQINHYHDFNLSSPFWLAPLPSQQVNEVHSMELKRILGWAFTHRLWNIILIISLVAVLLIQFRLAFICFVVNGSKPNIIFTLNAIIVLSTFLVITYWLVPIKVEDNFNYEVSTNALSRKHFIVLAVFSAFSISFYRLTPFLPRAIYKRTPRYKVKKIKPQFSLTSLRNTLVLNRKSGIVSFVDNNGKSLSFNAFKKEGTFDRFKLNLVRYNDASELKVGKSKPRMRIGHSSWHAEKFALEKIEDGKFDDAAQMLLYSIKQNLENHSASHRLHDLLALICVVHRASVQTNTLPTLIELSNNTNDVELVKRAKKWSSGAWEKKIIKTKGTANFNGIRI